MSILAAIFAALAIVATQALHGGLLVPALALPGEGALVLAAVFGLVAVGRNRAPGSAGPLAAGLVFLGYVLWRCGHLEDHYFGRMEFGLALSVGLTFAIGFGSLTTTRARFVFLGIIISAAAAQAVLGFFQFAHGGLTAPLGWISADLRASYELRFATRAHGLFLNPNQFAWLEGWAALFCVSMAAWSRVTMITRVVLIYLAAMFIAATVLSGSRGGLISLGMGLGAFSVLSAVGVLTMLRRGRGWALTGTLLLVVFCVGAGAFIYSSNWVMQARMDSISQEGFRNLVLEHARRQFETAPFIGTGSGIFAYAARLYRTGNQSGDAFFVHDDWAQMLAEYGIVGFAIAVLAVAIFLGDGIRRFFRAMKRRAAHGDRPQSNGAAVLIGAISATVAFCAHSLTDFNLHVPANALLAGATLGLLAGTGGELRAGRGLQAGALRILGVIVTAVLAGVMALYVWKYGRGDYQNLLASNALAEGRVELALEHTNEGLRTSPRDAGLLANRGRALYAYESSLQFKGDANVSDDETVETTDDSDSAAESDAEASEEDSDEIEEPDIETLTPAEREKYYRGAVDAFSQAVALQPLERRLKIELANAFVEVGDRKEAERLLIDAIRLDPAHGYAYGAYGDFLYDGDRLDRALRIYELGSVLPGGGYCGERAQDVREERNPPPDEDAPADDSVSPEQEGATE